MERIRESWVLNLVPFMDKDRIWVYLDVAPDIQKIIIFNNNHYVMTDEGRSNNNKNSVDEVTSEVISDFVWATP